MAKEKKNTPAPIAKDLKKDKDGEFERPMTQKEKEEYIRERNSQLRKAGKLPPSTPKAPPPPLPKPTPSQQTKKGPPSEVIKKTEPPEAAVKTKTIPKGPCKENNFTQPCQKTVKRDISKVESRAFPGEVQPKKSRARSPSPLRKCKPGTNRIESDDEDDYDSEMDDFIDDSDAKIDVSAEISKLFGYDRRKYRDDDFDDRQMENNRFSDIMKEEARSARIGRMEDLEDMRREEEENKKKEMMKKRKLKGKSRY